MFAASCALEIFSFDAFSTTLTSAVYSFIFGVIEAISSGERPLSCSISCWYFSLALNAPSASLNKLSNLNEFEKTLSTGHPHLTITHSLSNEELLKNYDSKKIIAPHFLFFQ